MGRHVSECPIFEFYKRVTIAQTFSVGTNVSRSFPCSDQLREAKNSIQCRKRKKLIGAGEGAWSDKRVNDLDEGIG